MTNQKKGEMKVASPTPHSRWSYKNIPYLVFAGLVFSLPFERIPAVDTSILGVSITMRLGLVFGALLILCGLLALRQKIAVFRDRVYVLLGAFIFVYFLAALASGDLKRALFVFVFTLFTALIGASVSLVWNEGMAKKAHKALVYATWIVLIFGFYQYVGDILNLPGNLTGLRDIYTKAVFGFPRIQSVGLEPLYYANFLLLPLFYFGAKFLNGDDERPYLIALIVTQIVLTVSRGALIAGAVGLVTLLILCARRARYTQTIGFIGLVLVGIAIGLNLTGVNANFNTSQNGNNNNPNQVVTAVVDQAINLNAQDDRVRNRDLAIQAFKTKPLLGIGPGNFNQFARDNYEGYRAGGGYVIVNNEPLELLAESGIIGFGLFLGFIGLLWWRIAKLAWLENGSEAGIWPSTIAAYLVAMAIQYQTFSTLYIIHLWVLIGIALALTTPGLRTLAANSTLSIASSNIKKPKPTKESPKKKAKPKPSTRTEQQPAKKAQ